MLPWVPVFTRNFIQAQAGRGRGGGPWGGAGALTVRYDPGSDHLLPLTPVLVFSFVLLVPRDLKLKKAVLSSDAELSVFLSDHSTPKGSQGCPVTTREHKFLMWTLMDCTAPT